MVMARFKRLTAAEARTLTRSELLERIEREQRYWHRKGSMSDGDRAAEREFRRIMYAAINPGAAVSAALALLQEGPNAPAARYWDERPDVPDQKDRTGWR